MDTGKTVYVTNCEGFRKWLEKNSASAKEIWLVIFKEASGVETLTHDEALEEAICFGWAEGGKKSIDDEKYAQRFTPRKADTKWTEAELEIAGKLVSDDRLTEAGLATLPESLRHEGHKEK